jgi:hypothetical protein
MRLLTKYQERQRWDHMSSCARWHQASACAVFSSTVPLPEDEAPEHIGHAIFDLVDEHRGSDVPAHEIAQRISTYGSGVDSGDPTRDKPPTVH